jgi:hypothetical protein
MSGVWAFGGEARVARLRKSAKGAAARRHTELAATQKGNLREALGGELDTAAVLRDSARAQRARLLAATQKGNLREALGGELDTAAVLRDSARHTATVECADTEMYARIGKGRRLEDA